MAAARGGNARGPGIKARTGAKSGFAANVVSAPPGAAETFCTHDGHPLGRLARRGAKLRPRRRATAWSETSVRTYQTVVPPLVPRYSGSVATLFFRSMPRTLVIARLRRGRSPARAPC